MKITFKDILDFLVVSVLLKAIVAQFLVLQLKRVAKGLLVRSEKDAIYYLHYKNKALGNGHKPDSPKICIDERCIHI